MWLSVRTTKPLVSLPNRAWTKGVRFYDYPNATEYIDQCYSQGVIGKSDPLYLYCGCFVTNQIEYNTRENYHDIGARTMMLGISAVKVPVKQVFYVCPCVKEITILSDKNYDEIDVEMMIH